MAFSVKYCAPCMWPYRRVRWMVRSRRWRPVVCLCSCGIIFFLLSLVCLAHVFRHELFNTFVKCSDEDSRRFIREMCTLYSQGAITGSLCQPLCVTGEVQFDKCTDFHGGKEVHLMKCTNFCQAKTPLPAVLKSSNVNITILFKDHPDLIQSMGEREYVVSTLKNHIQEMVKSELGFVPFDNPDVISVIWESHSDQYFGNVKQINAAYRTVMLLMEQTEYKITKSLKHTGVVPAIYGTCGPMYLQESCPSGQLDFPLHYFVNTKSTAKSPRNWKEKATAAVSLLNLLQHFDHDFPEVLHLCDVKGSNFGVCADGRVKMIDMDSVFFNTSMFNIFSWSVCKTHQDCNFFDCGGWCNTDTGHCYPVKTNNNLQLVCKKILTGPFPGFLDTGGVLSGAPVSVARELYALLQQCTAQTSLEAGIPIYKPPAKIQQKLTHLLLKTIASLDFS